MDYFVKEEAFFHRHADKKFYFETCNRTCQFISQTCGYTFPEKLFLNIG